MICGPSSFQSKDVQNWTQAYQKGRHSRYCAARIQICGQKILFPTLMPANCTYSVFILTHNHFLTRIFINTASPVYLLGSFCFLPLNRFLFHPDRNHTLIQTCSSLFFARRVCRIITTQESKLGLRINIHRQGNERLHFRNDIMRPPYISVRWVGYL